MNSRRCRCPHLVERKGHLHVDMHTFRLSDYPGGTEMPRGCVAPSIISAIGREVRDAPATIAIDENVLGLEIPMDDAARVVLNFQGEAEGLSVSKLIRLEE